MLHCEIGQSFGRAQGLAIAVIANGEHRVLQGRYRHIIIEFRHRAAINAFKAANGFLPLGNTSQTLDPELNAEEIFAIKPPGKIDFRRSEEHTSELQSLMRISYAVFCLKKNKNHKTTSKLKTKN